MTDSEEESAESENKTPGPLADDLASDGYRRTDSTCIEDECGDGLMWYKENMLVCDLCSFSVDLEARRSKRRTQSPWDRYDEDPPRYHNSGRVRMPGGFLSAYDWVTADDVDSAVNSVDPEDFYR